MEIRYQRWERIEERLNESLENGRERQMSVLKAIEGMIKSAIEGK
jgi:hypothetical protein